MIKIKQVYDAYPSSDLLALPFEITDATTLADLEGLADNDWAVGDTLFMFLCRELCSSKDEIDEGEARRRVGTALLDLSAVADALEVFATPTTDDAEHIAKLLATHLFGFTQMQPGDEATYSLGKLKVAVKCKRPDEFTVDGKAVGNLYGAMEVYTRLAFTVSRLLVVVPHG
jgi:hypothetical protein